LESEEEVLEMARVRKPRYVTCYCKTIKKTGGDNCECFDPNGKSLFKTKWMVLRKIKM